MHVRKKQMQYADTQTLNTPQYISCSFSYTPIISPSPFVSSGSRLLLVYWKSPKNMQILSAAVFPKLFLSPIQFYPFNP